MKTKYCIALVSSLIIVFSLGSALAATVEITDLSGNNEIWVQPSTVFDVNLSIELSAAESTAIASNGITGYTVDIIWDPLVELQGLAGGSSYTFVDVIDKDTGSAPVLDWVGNELEFSGFNFGTAITGSHLLATLTLHCLGIGDTELIPEPHFTVTQTLGNFGLSQGDFLENHTQVEYAGLLIHQVPIPSTILLLGGGLAALVAVRRRRS